MENRQLPLLDDLRQHLAQRQVVLIVGAGVSIATTNHADVASWPGLLRSGVARVEAVIQALPNRWADRQREAIASGDLDDLLGVAEQVARRLGAPRGGEFRRWLRETVGQLTLADRTVIDALVALGTPLCTTNYDRLLESASGLEAVTWKDPARCERVLRGDEKAIVHLHGYYRDPESVVLGLRSYEDVLGHEPAQALLRALRTYRTLLFVGYGGGLADPNFTAFLGWCERVFPESEYRHYRLARNQEVATLQAEHSAGQRLFVLGYGPEHADLAEFLRGLLPDSESGASAARSVALPSPREQALVNAVAAYRAYIERSPRIQRVRFADVASRAEDRERPPAFDRLPLFVLPTLELRPRHPERMPAPEPRLSPGASLPESSERTLLQVLTQPERLCLLIGGPGSGKTELGLWLLAKQCTPGQALPELPSDCIPVRIELRQFDHAAQNSSQHYDFFAHLEQSLSAMSVRLDASQLRELHAAGRLLWIFDGMDEVRTPERRQHYGELIHTLVRDVTSRAVVTSRAIGCEALGDSLGSCPMYSLRDFNDKQIDDFLRNWYALEFVDEPEVSERRRQRLAQAIEQSRTVRDLCRNPLLLTLLALLNRGDELPRRRHKVFERALDLMVGQWDANKHLPAEQGPSAIFEREDKIQFLRELAWAMHNNLWKDSQNNLLQREDLLRFTTEFVKKQFNTDEDRAQARARALIVDLEERNQTITYLGNDQYGFVHKTFLEYLAAEALVRFLSPKEQIERFVGSVMDQNSWEVLTLACGLLDDQDRAPQLLHILQSIIAQQRFVVQDWQWRFFGYAFAIRCLAELRKVQQEPMRSLALGLMRLFQQDALAIQRAEISWWPFQMVEALRFFGPRWPEPELWFQWVQRAEWLSAWKDDVERAAVGVSKCALASASPEQRVKFLIAILNRPAAAFEPLDILHEARLLGPWTLEEALALATGVKSAEPPVHGCVGIHLAEESSPAIVRQLLQSSLSDRILLQLAIHVISSVDTEIKALALYKLLDLTHSSSAEIRAGAAWQLASEGTHLNKVRARLKQLAVFDPVERVRYRASQALLSTDKQEWSINQILTFQQSQDRDLLSWLATDLANREDYQELVKRLWLKVLHSDSRRHETAALRALSHSYLDHETKALIDDLFRSKYTVGQIDFDSLKLLLEFKDPTLDKLALDGTLASRQPLRRLFYYQPYTAKLSDRFPLFSEYLRSLLNTDIDDWKRLRITEWLYTTENNEADYEFLKRLVKTSSDMSLRIEAARVFADWQSLLHVARSAPNPADRTAAIWFLGRILGTPKPFVPLLAIAQAESDPAVRWMAFEQLQNFAQSPEQQESLEPILDELARQTSDEKIRLKAAQHLALYPVLLQLAEAAQDEKIRLRAADTLTWLDIRAEILRLGLSHHRRGRVDLAGQTVGIIEETEQGSRFLYNPAWLRRRDAEAISLTLPLRPEPYESVGLHPFFENLLPEGAYLDLVAKKTNVARSDKFGLLLATCGDCAGAVEVHPLPRS